VPLKVGPDGPFRLSPAWSRARRERPHSSTRPHTRGRSRWRGYVW